MKTKKMNLLKDAICDIKWVKTKKRKVQKEYKRELSVIDIYCGCGGLSLGILEACELNRIKLNIKLAIDIDENALKVYKKNFQVNNNRVLCSDINSYFANNLDAELEDQEIELKKDIENVDIIVAGPPCQGHSDLNNRTRRNDPRNLLYLNAVRAIKVLLPKAFILENVSTVIHDKNNVIEKSISCLKKAGYSVSDYYVEMTDLGLAQKRKRHFLIGLKNNDYDLGSIFKIVKNKVSISSYIDDLIDEFNEKKGIFYTPSLMSEVNQKRADYLFCNKLYDLPDSLRPKCHKNKKHSYNSVYGRLHWDKPSQTITSGFGSMGQGRYLHPLRKRVITPHEAARLQGFPDFFNFNIIDSRLSLHKMIANAVPPKVSAIIVNELIKNKIL